MARNLLELEKELMLLEIKKQEQLKQLKQDVTELQEALSPINILKRGVRDMFTTKGGNGIAGIAGSFLIDELLFKKSSFLKRWLSRLVASRFFSDLLKGEDSVIRQWAIKLRNMAGPEPTSDGNEAGKESA